MIKNLFGSLVFIQLLIASVCQANLDLGVPQGDAQSARIQPLGGEWPIPLQIQQVNLSELQGIWQVVGERLILTIEESKWDYLGLTVGNVQITSLNKKKTIFQGFGFMVDGVLRGVISKDNKAYEYFSVGRGIHSTSQEQVYYLLRGTNLDKMDFYQLIP